MAVGGARKVLAEMQGQVAAVEAAENLESVLESKQSNAAVLKVTPTPPSSFGGISVGMGSKHMWHDCWDLKAIKG